MSEKVIMLGNEAIARGAYEAGVKVSAAYPGTPSTEISENLVKYKDSLYCEWSPNEKVATEVAIGASVSGVRAMSCMKHVGFNVAAYLTWESTEDLSLLLQMIRDFTALRTSRIQEWSLARHSFQ